MPASPVCLPNAAEFFVNVAQIPNPTAQATSTVAAARTAPEATRRAPGNRNTHPAATTARSPADVPVRPSSRKPAARECKPGRGTQIRHNLDHYQPGLPVRTGHKCRAPTPNDLLISQSGSPPGELEQTIRTGRPSQASARSEEHTSELQSRRD